MKASSKSRLGFTLIELLVTIAIIAILASLLLGGVARAKRSALDAKCKSNLRQIGVSLSVYVSDEGAYPRGFWQIFPPPGHTANMSGFMNAFWMGKLYPYLSLP